MSCKHAYCCLASTSSWGRGRTFPCTDGNGSASLLQRIHRIAQAKPAHATLLLCHPPAPPLSSRPKVALMMSSCILQGWRVLEHTTGRSCVQKLQSCMTRKQRATVLRCVRTGTEGAHAAGISTVNLLMAYMKSGELHVHAVGAHAVCTAMHALG